MVLREQGIGNRECPNYLGGCYNYIFVIIFAQNLDVLEMLTLVVKLLKPVSFLRVIMRLHPTINQDKHDF
jgi:hypothetical protein